jgi:hypothetical protein
VPRPKKTVDAAEVERLASEGLAEYQIAATCGVHPDTFTRIKREEPEVEAALKRGRAQAVGEIENVMFEAAKQAKADPRYQTSAIFWLKCNAGWKETQVIEHDGMVGVYDARARLAEKLGRLAEQSGD